MERGRKRRYRGEESREKGEKREAGREAGRRAGRGAGRRARRGGTGEIDVAHAMKGYPIATPCFNTGLNVPLVTLPISSPF